MTRKRSLTVSSQTKVRNLINSCNLQYVTLEAEEIKIICPFCGGDAKDRYCFNLNIESGAARCWRSNNCGWVGNVVKLFSELKGANEKDMYRHIFSSEGMNLNGILQDIVHHKQRSEHIPDVGNIEVLPEELYDVIEHPNYDKFIYWLHQRDYDPQVFLKDHIVHYAVLEDLSTYNRVLFQVNTGTDIAYQLYAFDPDTKPKTLNPPDHVLSSMVYNYNNVQTEPDYVFITEGIFDCARLMSWNLSAVCIFGTNIHPAQIYHLSELNAKELVILLDNGAKRGDKDASEVMASMLAPFVKHKQLSIATLKEDQLDPDAATQEDIIEAFSTRKIIHRAEECQTKALIQF